MPRLIMIAVHKSNNVITGMRFMNFESINRTEVVDIPLASVIQTLKVKGNGCIENVELDKKSIKCINGSIDRYGIIEDNKPLSSPVVIINRVVDEKSQTIGYDCTGTNGKVWRIRTADAIKLVSKYGIANGKLVEVNGDKFISAIEGNYKEVSMEEITSENADSKKDKPQIIEGLDQETLNKIKRIMGDNRYNGSYVEKVIGTIRKNKRASERQVAVINSTYDDWFKDKENERKSAELLEFISINSNELQVSNINDPEYSGEIEIPSRYKGKIVTSIGANAFERSAICKVIIPATIKDIGQAAFKGCRWLREADLSKGAHRFIANELFFECRRLEQINMGTAVEKIHELAFYKTKDLKSVVLPKPLNTIARKAFMSSGIEHVEVNAELKIINDGAFMGCEGLKEIELGNVTTIGARAFSDSGLEYLITPKTAYKIGRYAFYNTKFKGSVNIEEGMNDIGEYAFSKDKNDETNGITDLYIPKSVMTIGNNAFGNVEKLWVYHGTAAEAYCIGFGLNFEYLDKENDSNSTSARQRAAMVNASLMDILESQLSIKCEEGPVVELNESKLIDLPINKNMANELGIEYYAADEHKDAPEFNEAVNYLTAVEPLYKTPFEYEVMKCIPLVYIEARYIYNLDGNRIVRFRYIKKDTLEESSFIAIMTGNHLRYVCEDTSVTDINVPKYPFIEAKVPLKLLHPGDTIGREAVIAGEKASIAMANGKGTVGKYIESLVTEGMVKVNISVHDTYYLDLRSEQAVKISDQRTYDRNHVVKRGVPDALNIMEIMDKSRVIEVMKGNRKPLGQNRVLFKEMADISKQELDMESVRLATVFPECIDKLYIIAKEFKQRVDTKDEDSISVEMLDEKIFGEIAESYWMIQKDAQWYRSIGKRSLNKIGQYNIGSTVVEEYVSNQVVKFSNPYMQGGKESHIFIQKKNGMITGIYASRMSLGKIAKSLYQMVTYDTEWIPNFEIMAEPKKIDYVDTSLFFKFYDVLQKNKGWECSRTVYDPRYSTEQCDVRCEFGLSIYKPTGVMYLVLYHGLLPVSKKGKEDKVILQNTCTPLFKVGDIDRALKIANTTNTVTSAKKLGEELVAFAQALNDLNRQKSIFDSNSRQVFHNYLSIRKMTMAGESRMSEYKGLANDRLLMMIGTKAAGEPKVYTGNMRDQKIVYDDTEDILEDEQIVEVYNDDDEDTDESEYNTTEIAQNDAGIDTEDFEDEEFDYADEYDTEDEADSMMEFIANMSDDELKAIGVTPQQRDEVLKTHKR